VGAIAELLVLARELDAKGEKYALNPQVMSAFREAAQDARLRALRLEGGVIPESLEPRYRVMRSASRVWLVPEEFVEAFIDIAMDCSCTLCSSRAPIDELLPVVEIDEQHSDLAFESPRWL
jgi:hypothetical protein